MSAERNIFLSISLLTLAGVPNGIRAETAIMSRSILGKKVKRMCPPTASPTESMMKTNPSAKTALR